MQRTARSSQRTRTTKERREDISSLCLAYQRGLAARTRIEQGSWKDERELGGLRALASSGDAASRQLVTENYPLIIKLVKLACYGLPEGRVEFNDLLQYGVIAWLKGCARYDPTKGVTISTFAQHWVKEAVHNAYRDTSQISGVHGGDLGIAVRRYMLLLEQDAGAPVRPEAVAAAWNTATVARCAAMLSVKPEHVGRDSEEIAVLAEAMVRRRGQWLDAERVIDSQRRLSQLESLDAPISEDGEETVGTTLSTKRSPEEEVLERMERVEQQKLVEQCIADSLSHDEYVAIRLYFGLSDTKALAYEEIADVLQISVTTTKRLVESALGTLREDPALQELVGIKRPARP